MTHVHTQALPGMYTNTYPDRKVIAFPDIKQIKMLSQPMLTTGTQCSRVWTCVRRMRVIVRACNHPRMCVCVSEGESDKNMKDSLIWINLEHENETDRQTRRGRQGELDWVLRLNTYIHTPIIASLAYRTVTETLDFCVRGLLRRDVAKYKIAQVN